MLLFAGTASLLSFKYFILLCIVKKLKQWSISAGNFLLIKRVTSETIRNNIDKKNPSNSPLDKNLEYIENIKKISDHVPKHLKLLNDKELGHYLAGLIDGNGYFSTKKQLVIIFNSSDPALAYYIKKRIGYGTVKKIKNAYLYIIVNNDGLIKVLNLINGKLRTLEKFNQVINNLLIHYNFSKEILTFYKNNSNDFNNYWLTGFSDIYSEFKLKIDNVNNISEIRLNFKIYYFLNLYQSNINNNILILIKEIFGGYIAFNKFNTDSFGSAKKIINYFDKFHLQSSKHVYYLKWRKCYIHLWNSNYLKILIE